MKLTYTVWLVAVTLILSMSQAQAAPREDRWHGACSTWFYGETLKPGDWHTRPLVAIARIKRLIVCEFDKWAPGQADHALYVADRESSYYPWAQNVTSLCSGLFQHMLTAWYPRVYTHLMRWEYHDWLPPWYDPRANTEVAAKMVAEGGWGPWGD